jgi:ribonuclease HI
MKTLKFIAEQIPEIEQGRQTKTWRLFDDKKLDVGDELQFVNSDNATVFGYGMVKEITIKRIKDLNEFDQEGHKKYENLELIVEGFKRFYGPNVTKDSIIKVVKYSFSKKRQQENVVKKESQITEVKLYTDGGSRGNPGPSATGFVITDMDNNVVTSAGKYLGITTNNQAEYQAVQQGLNKVFELGAQTVHVYMDSLLVVSQMNGIFKIKNRELWPIHQSIKDIISKFNKVSFTHVPREMNKLADSQVNEILDAQEKSGIASGLL